ncbi:MAG: prepilin-type N-terminal cleavage/methylation domain-containing protein [Planctomycetes bacterium]|nr:prepilin-type N-terminal cleavage/methylation domain-containing protein [Planctomycetota bacterium]
MRRGFTLVEVLIALCIIAIAFVPLLHLQLRSIALSESAENLSRAMLLARAKMAQTLAEDDLSTGARQGDAPQEDSATVLHWKTTVTEASPAGLGEALESSALRCVSVQVTWKDGASEKRVLLTTYAASQE